MAHDVFISYSSKNKVIADALCAGLEAEKIRCWIAPRDVLPGGNYGESIIHAMAACRVVVLVFSSATNTSPAVVREMERAMHHGLPIIPFRLEDIPMSPSLEFFLASCHWLDAMHPPVEQHIAKLVHATKALLGREVGPAPAVSSLAVAKPKHLWVAVILGAAVVAGIGFGLKKFRDPQPERTSTVVPVEVGKVTIDVAVFDGGRGAIADHFQGSSLADVKHVVQVQTDGSLNIADSCSYLDAWKDGAALTPIKPGAHGFFNDTPLLLEVKLLNATTQTIFFTRAVAEVERSDSKADRLLVIETPQANEITLVSVGAIEPGPVSFQAAIAGPEDALDHKRLPAAVLLGFEKGRGVFPLTNIPATGESTAYGQLEMGAGPQRNLRRFEIALGVAATKSPTFPAIPKTDYQLALHDQGGPYEIECPLSQFIQAGEGDRFQIQLAAPLTSTHRFRLRLDYDDGSGSPKRIVGPWIEAFLFVENVAR